MVDAILNKACSGNCRGLSATLHNCPVMHPCTEAGDPDGNAPEAIACPRLNAGAVAAHHAATAPHVTAGPLGPVLLTLCNVSFLNVS